MHYMVLVFTKKPDDLSKALEPFYCEELRKDFTVEQLESMDWDEVKAKWPFEYDWYTVGWGDNLPLKNNGHSMQAKIKDVDWGPTGDEFDKVYADKVKLINMIAAGQLPGIRIDELKRYPSFNNQFESMLSDATPADEYAIRNTNYSPARILMPDGTYYGPGWWESPMEHTIEERKKWAREFKTRFIDTLNPNTYATVVNCHN